MQGHFLLTIQLLVHETLCANAQVQSGSFNFALKFLLSKSTPAINIADAANNFNNYIFLGAREIEEYNVSHLRNAFFVGAKDFKLDEVRTIDKTKPVIVYCSIGKRSEDITLQLKRAGFTHVMNLYGGIFEWVNQGHPVYNNSNQLTDSVHAYNHFWGRWLDKGIKVYD